MEDIIQNLMVFVWNLCYFNVLESPNVIMSQKCIPNVVKSALEVFS